MKMGISIRWTRCKAREGGRPWGLNLMQEGITSMHLVCTEEEEPVIDVFTRADPFARRRISFRGGRAILAGGGRW